MKKKIVTDISLQIFLGDLGPYLFLFYYSLFYE